MIHMASSIDFSLIVGAISTTRNLSYQQTARRMTSQRTWEWQSGPDGRLCSPFLAMRCLIFGEISWLSVLNFIAMTITHRTRRGQIMYTNVSVHPCARQKYSDSSQAARSFCNCVYVSETPTSTMRRGSVLRTPRALIPSHLPLRLGPDPSRFNAEGSTISIGSHAKGGK
jgi:hypothetical protein